MRVSLPSPTAATLGKFGDIPVSLATGVPDISIPLWTVKGRTLELPVVLKYHASGVRVEEIGGWAGLGWALEAGGAITRTVRGLVDELSGGYYLTGHTWYNSANWPVANSTLIQNIVNWSIDGEPDRFFFNFAGRSGQFVMGPTSTSPTLKEFRTIPHQELRIEPTFGSGGITSWRITTEDGTRYTFGAAETTTDHNESDPPGIPSHVNESYVSTWNLTGIRAAGGDTITLYYTPYGAQHSHQMSEEKFDFVSPTSNPCVPDLSRFFSESYIEAQRLDSITAATSTVRFTKAAALRLDEPSEPRLDRITVVTPSGVVLRQFLFVHDYFPGNRLRLTNVFEQDRNGVSLPPYTFTYDGQTLPPRTSFSQDFWGFYNGQSNTTLVPAMVANGVALPGAKRTPNGAFGKAGILTRITYPTGGFNEFDYEGNDYGAVAAGGAPIGDLPPKLYIAQTWSPTTVQFTVQGTQQIAATVTHTQSHQCEGEFTCPFTQLDGGGQHWEWRSDGVSNLVFNPGVTYTIMADVGWGQPDPWAQIQVQFTERGPLQKAPAGGVRIKELRTGDAMGNVSIRKFFYTLASDPALSSGRISFEPEFWYQWNTPTCVYFSRSSMSRLPMGSGTSVGYSEVLVWDGATGQFGKTRHRFRSTYEASDQVDFAQGSQGTFTHAAWLPFMTPTSREWKRGQELGVTDYSSTDVIQKRGTSVYAFRDEGTPEPVTTRRFRGISIGNYTAARWIDGQYYVPEAYAYSPFEIITAWSYLSEDTTTVYGEAAADSIKATRTYTYANPAHLQLTQLTETNSNGTQRITRMKYPADYSDATIGAEGLSLNAMKGTAHTLDPVIERWVSEKIGATETVVRAEVTTFKAFGAGQYLPFQRYLLNNPTAVTNYGPTAVSCTPGPDCAFTKDSRHLLQETANAYTTSGQITQLTDPRSQVTNYEYAGGPNSALLSKITRVNNGSGSDTVDLVTNIAYNTDGFVSSIKDEGGTFRYFFYDLFGRLDSLKNHNGVRVKAYGYVYSRTSPSWTFNPSSPNAVIDTTFIQQTPTQTSVVSTGYLDGLGRPIQTVVRDGGNYHVTATQYDVMGRSWRVWKPYTRTTAGYDPGFTTNATTFYNTYHSTSTAKPYTETSYAPDALARVKQVTPEYIGTSPTAVVVSAYGVDAANKQQHTLITDESLKKTRTVTDLFGNTVKSILGAGAAESTVTQFSYNVLGQRLQTTDPRGLNTTYVFDTRGLQTSRTSPDAGSVSAKYDQAGNVRYTQDANQAAAGQVYFTTYDFAGRPLRSGLGTATFSSLNGHAPPQPFETADANCLIVRKYDAKPGAAELPWSQFSTQITPLTLANVGGRLASVASKSSGAWQVTLFSYDADGQVATRYTLTQANGGGSVWTALNDTVTYTRDLRGGLAQRSQKVGTSAFYHWYDYNARGLLWKTFASTTPTKPATPDVTDTYLPTGQPQNYQFQGGPLVPIRYTIRGQTEKVGDPTLTTYPFSARYAYLPNGVVDTAEFYSAGSPAAQKRYRYAFGASRYDAINRLKGADFSNWSGSAWTTTLAYDLAGINYDAAGNLTALQRYRETATLIDNVAYTNATTSNRLMSITDAVGATAETWDAETGAFSYDANGNVTSAPAPYSIAAVTYDPGDLPLSITRSGVTTTYRHDDGGQRITKQVGTGNTDVYVREGPITLGMFTVNGAGAVVSSHFNILRGNLVAGRHTSAGTRTYYHADMLGSTRAVVLSTTGVVVESYDFEPWGLLMPGRTLGSGTKEGFTGKEQDAETGLDYFGARYYMPALGRWASADPLADATAEWSAYTYVLNNPLALVDPMGLAPCGGFSYEDKAAAPVSAWSCIEHDPHAAMSTHTDNLGNIIAVYDDGDFGVYSHDRITKEELDACHAAGDTKCGGGIRGWTLFWDEFMNHDNTTGLPTTVATGRIHFGLRIDDLINHLSQLGGGRTGGIDWFWEVLELAAQSRTAGPFNIKDRVLGHTNGYILGGVYVSGRSAGGYLAGRNAGLARPGEILDYPWYIASKIAAGYVHGGLNLKGPRYGEIEYTVRWFEMGFWSAFSR